MGWPNLNIFEDTRRRLAKASSILNIIGVCLCLIVLITGAFIHGTIKQKAHLVEGFNSDGLSIFMIVIGILGTFLSAVGIKICWVNHKPHKREEWSMYLFAYIICVLILFISVFIAGIMCFASIAMLRNAFSTGIYSGMKHYYSSQTKKSEIDRLQIEFSCCGSKAYTDWFHISWIHEDYLSTVKKNFAKKTGEVYLNDDAPFSCCDPNFDRPCIHHHVHDNDLHYNYDFRTGITLYKTGCTNALMDFYGKVVLLDIGGVIMFVSMIQLIILILMRFLQTSIDASIEAGDMSGPAYGFLFPCGPPPPGREDEDRKPLLQSEKIEYPTVDDDFDSFDDQFDEVQPNTYTKEPVGAELTLPGYSEEHIYSTIPQEEVLFQQGEPPADYEEPQIPPQYQEPIYENVGEFQDVYAFGQNDPLDDYGSVPYLPEGQQEPYPYATVNRPEHSFDALGIPPAPPLPDYMNQPPIPPAPPLPDYMGQPPIPPAPPLPDYMY